MIVESPSFDFSPTGFSFDNALLVDKQKKYIRSFAKRFD